VKAAQTEAYGLVHSITWPGVQFRRDVGYRAIDREQADS
jgi:phosphoribosylamine--glycine ligase